MRKVTLLVLLAVLALVNVKVYFHSGFPFTHDGENHLARFANYKVALREGQFPPRFAPNLVNHYGYPVFNYNYPLANISSVPFSILKINYESTFKFIVGSYVLFGLVGMYLWLKSLGFKYSDRLFGLSVFGLSPYLLSVIAFRGNIGELVAMMLLPWLLLMVEWLGNSAVKPAAKEVVFSLVVLVAFLLSHNVTVLFGLPLIYIYAAFRYGTKIQSWKKLILVTLISILLSLWFWLPALAEKSEIILDGADLTLNFDDHYVTWQQLITSPSEFGFSYLGSVDTLSIGLGTTQLLALVVITLLLLKRIFKLNKRKVLTSLEFKLTLLAWLYVVFQFELTKSIWNVVPLANFIQFPWRLSMFFSILIAPLAAYVFKNIQGKWKTVFILLIITQFMVHLRVRAVDYFHKNIVDYDAFSQSTSTLHENLPRTFTYKEFSDWQPTAIILEGEGEITIDYWSDQD